MSRLIYDALDVFWEWIVKDPCQATPQTAQNVFGRQFLVSLRLDRLLMPEMDFPDVFD